MGLPQRKYGRTRRLSALKWISDYRVFFSRSVTGLEVGQNNCHCGTGPGDLPVGLEVGGHDAERSRTHTISNDVARDCASAVDGHEATH
jgi:hypothetical protein